MSMMFEEIAWEKTPIGELVLQRRRLRHDGDDIWEIKLDGGYLMSSQFVEGEIALADLALEMAEGDALDVVIGGLGLGYTAQAALTHVRTARLTVVELIPQVIGWHRQRLLPLGEAIASDPRCHLVQGDFFALATGPSGLDSAAPHLLHDAILIDIDHSTTHFIDPASAGFYNRKALSKITGKLKPGGVFALWSTDAEDHDFVAALRCALIDVRVEHVAFETPYRDEPAFNLIYLGRKPG
jgi:spermidine synthase